MAKNILTQNSVAGEGAKITRRGALVALAGSTCLAIPAVAGERSSGVLEAIAHYDKCAADWAAACEELEAVGFDGQWMPALMIPGAVISGSDVETVARAVAAKDENKWRVFKAPLSSVYECYSYDDAWSGIFSHESQMKERWAGHVAEKMAPALHAEVLRRISEDAATAQRVAHRAMELHIAAWEQSDAGKVSKVADAALKAEGLAALAVLAAPVRSTADSLAKADFLEKMADDDCLNFDDIAAALVQSMREV